MSKIEHGTSWKCDLCDREVKHQDFPRYWTTYRFKMTRSSYNMDLHACEDCKWKKFAFTEWIKKHFAKLKAR